MNSLSTFAFVLWAVLFIPTSQAGDATISDEDTSEIDDREASSPEVLNKAKARAEKNSFVRDAIHAVERDEHEQHQGSKREMGLAGVPASLRGRVRDVKKMQKIAAARTEPMQSASQSGKENGDLNTVHGLAINKKSDGAVVQSTESKDQSAEENSQSKEVNDAAAGVRPSPRGRVRDVKKMQKFAAARTEPMQPASQPGKKKGDLNTVHGDAVNKKSDGAVLHSMESMESKDQSAEENDQSNEVNDDAAGVAPSPRGRLRDVKKMQHLATSPSEPMQSASQSGEEDGDLNTVNGDAVNENADGAVLQSTESKDQSAEENSQSKEVNDDAAGVAPSPRGSVRGVKKIQHLATSPTEAMQSASQSGEEDGDLNTVNGDAVNENSDGAVVQSTESKDQSAEENDQSNEVNDDAAGVAPSPRGRVRDVKKMQHLAASPTETMQSASQSSEEDGDLNTVNDDAANENADGAVLQSTESKDQSAEENSQSKEVNDDAAGVAPSPRGRVRGVKKALKLATTRTKPMQSASQSGEEDGDLNTVNGDAVNENSDGAVVQTTESKDQSAEENDQSNEVHDDADGAEADGSLQSPQQSADDMATEGDQSTVLNDDAVDASDASLLQRARGDTEETSEDEDDDDASTIDGEGDDSGTEGATKTSGPSELDEYLDESAQLALSDDMDEDVKKAMGYDDDEEEIVEDLQADETDDADE